MKMFFDKKQSKRLKIFLIVIMMWGHMFGHPDRLWDGVAWKSLFSVGGTEIEVLLYPIFHVAVPMFFFISGYGFYVTYQNGLNAAKLKSQVIGLYGKYWIVFLIVIPLCFALNLLQFNAGEFVLNFIGLSSSYCGEWWFLSTYLEILVSFWLLCFWRRKRKRPEMANMKIWAVSVLTATCGYGMNFLVARIGFDTSNLLFHEFYYLLIKQPMFVTGYLAAKTDWINEVYSWIKEKSAIIQSAFWMCAILVVSFVPYIEVIPETYIYLFYLPIFALCFCVVDSYVPGWIQKASDFMSKYTTYMWLCHSLLLYKFCQRIIYYFQWSVLCWIVLIGMTLLCSVLLERLELLLKRLWAIRKIRSE